MPSSLSMMRRAGRRLDQQGQGSGTKSSATAADAPTPGRATTWYTLAFLGTIGLTTSLLVLVLVTRGSLAPWHWASTSHAQALALRTTSYDSWAPLLRAHKATVADQPRSPYSVFFNGEGKFQYPPPTLWLAEVLPEDVVDQAILEWNGSALQRWNAWACWLAMLATCLLSVAILFASHARLGAPIVPGSWNAAALVALVFATGMTFFPLVVGHQLGQFQLTLNAVVAAGLLFLIIDRPFSAGLCIGLCCLVKPQYGVLLLWGLLRRERLFVAGLLLLTVPVVIVSAIQYGVGTYVDYVAVLRTLSQRGEVFWYNQSLAGVLHRFIDPAMSNFFDHVGSPLPPFRMSVYLASTAASLALLLAALAVRRPSRLTKDTLTVDFCLVLVASTVASPVAWNHHYGVVFPVLAATVPLILAGRAGTMLAAPLMASYLAIGWAVRWPTEFLVSSWGWLVSSHVFFGALVLCLTLLVARRQMLADGPTAAAS